VIAVIRGLLDVDFDVIQPPELIHYLPGLVNRALRPRRTVLLLIRPAGKD
jgi:hypothetical protein